MKTEILKPWKRFGKTYLSHQGIEDEFVDKIKVKRATSNKVLETL